MYRTRDIFCVSATQILEQLITCTVLFRGKVFLDDGAKLRAEVVAVEPPLEERAGRAILYKVPEAV